jgi:hypothetical protein
MEVGRDWAGIPVEKDYWTLAEEFIEQRRRRRGTQVSLSSFVVL